MPPATRPDLIYPRYAHALAGATGGLATVTLLHPLDTLRTRLQSTCSAGTHAYATLTRLVAKEGFHALYRGAGTAAVGSIVSWACYFHFFQNVYAVVANWRVWGPYYSPAHLLSGGVAGFITTLVTNPIWVVKVRLQLQSARNGVTRYNGFFDGLSSIAKEEGIRGLYKGIGPSIILVSHGALQFTLYEKLKLCLKQDSNTHTTSAYHSLIASTASKLVASVMTYPMQVARTRMQERCADAVRYGRFDRAFMYIFKTEGITGLYRGLSANILRVTPQAAVTFVTYEQMLRFCATTPDR